MTQDVEEVAAVATKVRAFLAPKFVMATEEGPVVSTAGHCFNAAQVLAHALNEHFGAEQWIAGEGVFAPPDVMHRLHAGELCSWSDIEDAGQAHGWVLSADDFTVLVDITADQFGLAPVLVMDAQSKAAAAWLPRYFPDQAPSPKAFDWIREWCEKDLAEGQKTRMVEPPDTEATSESDPDTKVAWPSWKCPF